MDSLLTMYDLYRHLGENQYAEVRGLCCTVVGGGDSIRGVAAPLIPAVLRAAAHVLVRSVRRA